MQRLASQAAQPSRNRKVAPTGTLVMRHLIRVQQRAPQRIRARQKRKWAALLHHAPRTHRSSGEVRQDIQHVLELLLIHVRRELEADGQRRVSAVLHLESVQQLPEVIEYISCRWGPGDVWATCVELDSDSRASTRLTVPNIGSKRLDGGDNRFQLWPSGGGHAYDERLVGIR